MLPITIARWGVREGAMIGALGQASVAPGDALSVIFGLVFMIAGLPGGVLWLLGARFNKLTMRHLARPCP